MTDASAGTTRSPLLRVLRTPLGVSVTAVLLLLAVALLRGPYALSGFVAIVALLMIVAALVVVAVHELGHFAASRVVGFRTVALTIGPIRFLNTRDGVRVRSAEEWQLGGGMLMCLPRNGDDLRRRWMWVVLAGPAASLLFGVLCWPLARLLEDVPRALPSLASTTLLPVLGVVSFLTGVLSLLPARNGLLLSDGTQLRHLWRGDAHGERLCAQIVLTAAARDGVRPRDWQAEWIERVTALRDETPQDAIGQLGGFYWALDSGEVARATMYLSRARALMTKLPPLVRALIELDTAFHEARFRGDVAAARAALARADVPGVPRYALLRSEAAVLLAEARHADAAERAREALEALGDLSREELVRFPAEEEWLHAILEGATRHPDREAERVASA